MKKLIYTLALAFVLGLFSLAHAADAAGGSSQSLTKSAQKTTSPSKTAKKHKKKHHKKKHHKESKTTQKP